MKLKIFASAIIAAMSFSANAVVGHDIIENGINHSERSDYNKHAGFAQILTIKDRGTVAEPSIEPAIFCGGSILNDTTILTAAHCVDTFVYPHTNDSGVVVGSEEDSDKLFVLVYNNTKFNVGFQELKKVKSIHIQGAPEFIVGVTAPYSASWANSYQADTLATPANAHDYLEYNFPNYPVDFEDADSRSAPGIYDLAILKLETPISDNVQVMKIPSGDYPITNASDAELANLRVAGTGVDAAYFGVSGAPDDGLLNDVETVYVNDDSDLVNGNNTEISSSYSCNLSLNSVNNDGEFYDASQRTDKLREGTICSTHPDITKSYTDTNDYYDVDGFGRSCQGDSGGPLYAEVGGELIQVGVVSRGSTKCSDRGVSMYTDIRQGTEANAFIQATMDVAYNPTAIAFTPVADGRAYQNSVGDGYTKEEVCATYGVSDEHCVDGVLGGDDNDGDSTPPSSGGGGGGSTGLLTLLGLGLLTLRRVKK